MVVGAVLTNCITPHHVPRAPIPTYLHVALIYLFIALHHTRSSSEPMPSQVPPKDVAFGAVSTTLAGDMPMRCIGPLG